MTNTPRRLFLGAAASLTFFALTASAHPPMFENADSNNDGFIERAEFTAMTDLQFPKIDANSDGFITKEERTEFRAQRRAEMGRPNRQGGKKQRRGQGHEGFKPDANNDGMVDFSEFQAGQTRRFDKMDTDADGRISKIELRESKQKKRQRRRDRRSGNGQ